MQIRQQMYWHATYAFHSRQNSETFDVLHAFLSLVVAKLCDLNNIPVFWPTMYISKRQEIYLFLLFLFKYLLPIMVK